MNQEELKVIAESLAEASKIGTANALTYIQKGLEGFKKLEISLGECYGVIRPYKKEGVKEFVDFMLVYLDEAIKGLDKGKSE